jgi:ribonuclease R
VSGPEPADAFVAVLERRGRFLIAEPLFGGSESTRAGARPRRTARVVLASTRAGGRGRADGGGARGGDGDLVLVQPPGRRGGARILRLLGRPDVARDVIEGLMLDRGLSRGFDAHLESEARAAAERVRHGERRARDLRELPTFTVDPAGAGDFDDAISAEALDGEAVRVWVHIADVAAHVPEGSDIDLEARRRATSVYVPGSVEPMLPHALSSDACSLLPGADRAAVTVELELHGAVPARAAFYRSLIRSDVRLDYERVERIFAGHEPAREPWGPPLAAARRAAGALQRRREQRGALVLDSQEPEFEFDERGGVAGILARAQTESHRLIEHLMIAANEAVAELLSQRGVPCLYRVHERPEPERIERLVDQLASLDVPTPALPPSSTNGELMSSSQAAELVGELSARVEQHVRRSGRGRQALSSLVLRSLKQAYYSPTNLGHAGLQSSSYCHFTSPIRRYPDLVCHRALLSAVGGGERAPRGGELVELGVWASEREREAMIIERDADDVARCFGLQRVLYEHGSELLFAGEVAGLISAGAFVAFGLPGGHGGPYPAPPFEGMLPVRLLRSPAPSKARAPVSVRAPDGGRDWWELNEQGTILRGERTGATLRLGDEVGVRVARVDAVRGRVDLVPAG